MKKRYSFELEDAIEILGGAPKISELLRLTDHYETFKWDHRWILLFGFFEGASIPKLVESKIYAKNISKPLSLRKRAGHTSWVIKKARKYVMRLLYLRYRIDHDLTQVEANRQVLKDIYPKLSVTEKIKKQSNIRKATHCAKLDNRSVK